VKVIITSYLKQAILRININLIDNTKKIYAEIKCQHHTAIPDL